MLECAVLETLMRPLACEPILSIIIPTFNRAPELVQTVGSLAQQLKGALLDKVEIIICDNASSDQTRSTIKELAAAYGSVSYVLHARDEGGCFQLFAAPWRARGRWTWVFGSDDLLMDGGLSYVVSILEGEAPQFLTLNKRVFNADLSQQLRASSNAIPDRRFESFIDLFCAVGINQLAFISGNIELTTAARAIDPEPYLTMDTRHPHVVAFLEKHHSAPSRYAAEPYLVHRGENSVVPDYHAGNFFDYGVSLPVLLARAGAAVGAPIDLLERINGDKNILSFDPPTITFVDCMFENMLRAMGYGRILTDGQRRALETYLVHCRSDRVRQLDELWSLNTKLITLQRQLDQATSALDALKRGCLDASRAFARQ